MRYFEDLKRGDRFQSAPYSVSRVKMIAFSRSFDPQDFHLDAAVANRSMFKGLIASGWHTAAITMRLFVQTLNFAEGAIGLGVDELRWPNPVRPGDVLQVETDIVKLRPSRSKPGYGIVRLRNVTTNQNGKVVQTMMASALVRRRKSRRT
jgi:acyl dehydratase